jgi:protein-tyrosine-phosphatase
VLTVCTHNRTRSVMTAALLEALLGDQLGPDAVAVKSSGFGAEGLPPIPEAVVAMRRRGLDVSEHRSWSTNAGLVEGADLILTAERDHVVKVAALSPSAFRRTFTLPELLAVASAPGDRYDGHDVDGDTIPVRIAGWAEQLTEARRASEYLREPVAEIADPTGLPQRAFDAAVESIERQCQAVAAHVVRVARR